MLKVLLLGALLGAVGVLSQQPPPCTTPTQLHFRMSLFDHALDVYSKFIVSYDADNKRQVWFEEQNIIIPGRRFYEFLILNNENVFYTINLNTKQCTKSVPDPFKPFGVRENATFEDQYTFGGPSEQVLASEWSDRIPFTKRELWIGKYSDKNCYPIQEIFLQENNVTSTTTLNYYDIVNGIPNPNDFIPPPECETAEWADPPEEYAVLFL